jgi:hypothetical protein
MRNDDTVIGCKESTSTTLFYQSYIYIVYVEQQQGTLVRSKHCTVCDEPRTM